MTIVINRQATIPCYIREITGVYTRKVSKKKNNISRIKKKKKVRENQRTKEPKYTLRKKNIKPGDNSVQIQVTIPYK